MIYNSLSNEKYVFNLNCNGFVHFNNSIILFVFNLSILNDNNVLAANLVTFSHGLKSKTENTNSLCDNAMSNCFFL